MKVSYATMQFVFISLKVNNSFIFYQNALICYREQIQSPEATLKNLFRKTIYQFKEWRIFIAQNTNDFSVSII